jgi:hypothetical protein
MKVTDILDEQGFSYKGYRCTKDCSGHKAGYYWAQMHDIDSDTECPRMSSHPSFWEGCKSKTEEQ